MGSWGLWWVEMEVEVEMDLPGPWELQEPSGAAERGEAHLLCKCLLEPGVDSGKLLNYFKQRTKVFSLPLSSWILVKTKQNRNLGREPSDNDQRSACLARAAGPGTHSRMQGEQLTQKKKKKKHLRQPGFILSR